jgi:hypothetical protein
MRIKTQILILFLFGSISLWSQVTIYNQSGSTDSVIASKDQPKYERKKTAHKSIILLKTDAYEALFTGTAMLFVEKTFTDNFGVEVGAGITYGSTVNKVTMFKSIEKGSSLGTFIGAPVSSNPTQASDQTLRQFEEDYVKTGMGYAFSVTPKFYLEDDPVDGPYISLQAMYKNYKFTTPSAFDPYSPGLAQSLDRLNLTVNWGYNYEFSDHIAVESFFGTGVSFVKDVRNQYFYDFTLSKNIDTKVTYTPLRVHFVMGGRIVFYF